MPRGDAATARLHRDWLTELPRVTGKSLSRLATEIKVASSTLYRPLREGDDGTSTLHANTIAKIVAATGVPPPAVPGLPQGGRRSLRGFGEDAVPYEAAGGDPLKPLIAALTAGRAAMTAWTIATRAVELAGFLPGDVAILDLGNVNPKAGDVVCAQVYDWPKMKAITVVRVFEPVPPVKLLVARSLDPAFNLPLVIDDERVVVKGVFLSHRLRPPARA